MEKMKNYRFNVSGVKVLGNAVTVTSKGIEGRFPCFHPLGNGNGNADLKIDEDERRF